MGSGTTERQGKECVKKGLSTRYGTAEAKVLQGKLTTGVGLVRVAVVGIGTVGIGIVGGSAGIGSSGVGSGAIGLALTTLVWYWSDPRDTVGGFSPLVENREIGDGGSVGDMGETAVLPLFAASTFGDELVANWLVVSYCRTGNHGCLVRHVEKSVGWVTGTRFVGEVSPTVVATVVVAVVVVAAAAVAVAVAAAIGVGGAVVVVVVPAAFLAFGFLVRILTVGRIAKLGPGAGFGVVRRQVVLVDGRSPLVNRHGDRLLQVGQGLAGGDVGLVDDIPDERRRHRDDNHVTEYIVDVDKNRVA